MTKGTGKFAMSDDDTFIENEEGGSDGSSENGDKGQEGSSGDDSDNESGDGSGDQSGGDNKGAAGEAGGDNGADSDGDGSESGDDHGDDSDGSDGEGSEGDSGAEGGEGDGGTGEGGGEKGSEGSGEGEGEAGEAEGEGEEDIFADLGDEGAEGEGSESAAVDFKKIGSALDIELEKGTEEEFTEKVNQKIKDAQQEVDVSKFDPEAQRLVKHLNENEGKLGDFFVNPKIASLQNVLSMTAEDKFRKVRENELSKDGGTAEEIVKEIDEELSTFPAQKIVDIASTIDQNAQKLIAAEIEEIVGESEKNAQESKSKQAERVTKDRESMKNFVQKQDNFLGLTLTDKAKSGITKDIETGKFDATVDLTDEEIRFAAYMIKRSGGSIKNAFTKQLAEKSREGYNKGLDKTTGKLHKKKEDARGSGTGHQAASGGKSNFDNWADIE